MGYMIKSDILNALKENKEASLYLFRKNKKRRNVEEIIEFCYDSMGYVLDRLPQYRTDNVYEDAKDTNVLSKWIPCSEKLPEESDYYMACVYDEEADDYDYRKNWFAHKDDYDIDESEWRELMPFERVTAWMPLSKPYKEKTE